MSKPQDLQRLGRFLLSGGSGFLLYLLFATLLGHVGSFGPGVTAFLATLMAIVPTFLLQRSFTFRSDGWLPRQFASYLALQLLSSVVIGIAAHAGSAIGLQPTLAFVIAGIAGVAFSFFVQSTLIFHR